MSDNQQTEPVTEPVMDDLELLRAQSADNLAGWQRAKADYANLERNWQERQGQFMEMARGALALELLPIMSHFNLAVEHIPESAKAEAWVQGIVHIQREVQQLLEKMGVQPIAEADAFDPAQLEAVGHEPSEQPAGAIIRVVRQGYAMNDKVIQPSQVVVSSGPPPPEE
jgi:molecular chaperone GrpE